MSVTATVSLNLSLTEVTTANTAGSVTEAFTDLLSANLASGTGSSQVNVQWSQTATLTASSTTLNLQSLTGSTATKNFGSVKGLLLQNTSLVNSITIAPGASNGFSGPFSATETVAPGGVYFAYAPLAGWPVTGATNSITLTTSAAVPYVLAIVGV